MSDTSTMKQKDIKFKIAPHHFPPVRAGVHSLEVQLEAGNLNFQDEYAKAQYQVLGFDVIIPDNEILATYPPAGAVGDFAGTFPHIQFKRSTLPWDYEAKFEKERIPYIHLILLEEDEIGKKEENGKAYFEHISVDELENCFEDLKATVDILNCSQLTNRENIIPLPKLVAPLGHVRIQEHEEIAYLNLPKETSILVSNRMVLPNKNYKVFVCYTIKRNTKKSLYTRVDNLKDKTDQFVILHEWSFEAIGNELYQFDKERVNKIITNPEILKSLANVENSNVCTKTEFENFLKKNVVDENLKKIIFKDEKIDVQWLSYFKYEGKNLKGMLTDLKYQQFSAQSINDSNQKELFEKLFNSGKINLDHDLRGGDKLNSWYQGPLINDKASGIDITKKYLEAKDTVIPDHADNLILFNETLKMLDMTYAAAWQLGRLLIMTDVKILQELKKWKYEIRLNELMQLEGNSLVANRTIRQMPKELELFVVEFLKFKNFPIYYLLPHQNLNEEETLKKFKIDRFWMISFLFGIFSSGPDLKYTIFKKLVLENEEIIKVFDYKKDYHGIFMNSLIIKNWPHTNINLLKNDSKLVNGSVSEPKMRHTYKFVTSISDTQRLYVIGEDFSQVEIYLKNENCHYAVDFPVDVKGYLKDKSGKFLIETNYKPLKEIREEWFVDDEDTVIDSEGQVSDYEYEIFTDNSQIKRIGLLNPTKVLLGASLFFKQPQFIYQTQKNDSK